MSSPSPLVSVLTTCYNREAYIATVIESVLAQTFSDFEYIIVDDCSRDDTLAIARSFAAQDKRIRVFENSKNLGDYPNRNAAARVATGKYLKYVDADDYIYPTGLEVLVQMMSRFPEAGYGLCSLPQQKDQPYPIMLSPTDAYERHFRGTSLFHKAPLSAIMTRTAFEDVGGFPVGRMTSDYEMWLRLSQRFPVVLLPDGIVWYREHGEQEIRSYKEYLGRYEQITVAYLRSEACPLSEDAKRVFLQSQAWRCARQSLRLLLRREYRPARDVWVSGECGVAEVGKLLFMPFVGAFERLRRLVQI